MTIFLKDHLGNTRSVITDEQKLDAYPPASMEPGNAGLEKTYYSKIDETATPISSIAGYPTTDNYTNPNNYAAKVNGSSNKIGPGITLKVMAGDKFNLRVSSWWKTIGAANPGTPQSPLPDLIAVLANGFGGIAGSHATVADLQNGAVLTPGINSFLNAQNAGTVASKPKAFVNWILFDEQFKFVQSGSGAEPVGNNNEYKTYSVNDKPIDKNGYLYVYVSNETPNIDVFFDNLQVTQTRGPLLEETHYYPFGLQIAGISSKALGFGGVENRYKYNDGNELQSKEFSDGSGLEMYDANFRMYDPQIGRFMQADPLADMDEDWSPYSFANNNPILFNDPLGLAVPGTDSSKLGLTPGTAPVLQEVTVTAKKPDCKTCSSSSPSTKSITIGTSNTSSTAAKVADVVTDFIPLVSGGKDIYRGIRDGDGLQVLIGVGSIALDIFTFGGASIEKGIAKTVIRSIAEEEIEKGGLTLFKKNSAQALKTTWKEGDRFLNLSKQATTKATWKLNSRLLRQEMRAGNTIFDSYLKANGEKIITGGFLGAERNLLENRGWRFIESIGGWVPPR